MQINIRFYLLPFLLPTLSCLSYHDANLGRNNMDSNDHQPYEQHIAYASNRPSSQGIACTKSIFERTNQCINEFKENIQSYVDQLIKLNASNNNDNDIVHQHEKVIRQLYDVFSSDHNKLPFIYCRESTTTIDTYIASYNTILKLVKDNFQQPYGNAALSNDAQLIQGLHDKLFDSLKEQIIDAISDLFMCRLETNLSWCTGHNTIVAETKASIDRIIDSRLEINEKCLQKDFNMLKDCMNKFKLLARSATPDETSICQCLNIYFLRLRAKYWDRIQLEGKELSASIKNKINKLSKHDLNLDPLKNSVDRLIHTVCLYSAIRLLLYFGLLHRSMTLARANLKTPNIKSSSTPYSITKPYANQAIITTYLTDVYITMINLGMENQILNISIGTTYHNLIESCANIAKLPPEAAKE